MPFNPDEYLAKKSGGASGGFDPDSYLKNKGISVAPADPFESADVDATDRAIIKNLSANPEAGVRFLQQKYPNKKIERMNGEIRIDGKPLDPDNLSFSGMASYISHPGELLQDVGDIAFDVPAGIAQGAATTAAGVAGGSLGAGAGAIPAAMGASAASGAAIEATRNKLGQLFGLQQENTAGDLAGAAALGAVNPLLFGTGATAAKAAGKLTEEQLAKQSGLLSRLYNVGAEKVAPQVAEFFSGTPVEAIKTYKTQRPALEALAKGSELDLAEQAHQKLVGGLQSVRQRIGGELENAIAQTNETVDISKVKNQFKQSIDNFKNQAPKVNGKLTTESEEAVKAMQDRYKEIFGSVVDQEVQVTGDYGKKSLETVSKWQEMGDKIPATEAFKLQDQMKDLADMFSIKPALGRKSVSSAERTGKSLGQNAYHSLNEELDRVTSGLSSELKDQYKEYKGLEKSISNYFKTPEQTVNTLTNLEKPSRKALMRNLEEISNKYGVDVSNEAKILQAGSVFTNPSTRPIALGNSNTGKMVGLAGLGAGIGGMAGNAIAPGAGGFVGSTVGAAAMPYFGSPAMVKKALNAQMATEGALKPLLQRMPNPNASVPMFWDLMNERE